MCVIDIYSRDYYFTLYGSTKKYYCGNVCLVDYRYFDAEEMEAVRQANLEKYDDI